MRKVEVQYTPNIESIIEDHVRRGVPLEVTHTHRVSLADVKKDMEEWKPSAWKEFSNLTKKKHAFTVKKR